jgi:hypothetical protein
MSNVESSTVREHTTATGSVVNSARGTIASKGRLAREFLIYLVSREIQLSGEVAGWLRTTSQRLAGEGHAELAADCGRLSMGTWELREQLIALAYRLVARRNRGLSHRRINVGQLLELPPTAGMLAFIELNQQIMNDATPGLEIAVVSAVEQLLVGVVPLAIDVAGFDDDAASDDLVEVASTYEARFARAEALRQLTAAIAAVAPECAQALRDANDRAIDCFTRIIRESAEAAHGDSWPLTASGGRRGSILLTT